MRKQAKDAVSQADCALGSVVRFGQKSSLNREVGFGVESDSPNISMLGGYPPCVQHNANLLPLPLARFV